MKKTSTDPISPKIVNSENLERLGVSRLARLLNETAMDSPELKRRLRLELAAQMGPTELIGMLEKKLAALQRSDEKVVWRRRPGFIRLLDDLRKVIIERLALADKQAAVLSMLALIGLRLPLRQRLGDDAHLIDEVIRRATTDFGSLIVAVDQNWAVLTLVNAVERDVNDWLPSLTEILSSAPPSIGSAVHDILELRDIYVAEQ